MTAVESQDDANRLVDQLLAGKRRAAARIISLLEDEAQSVEALMRSLFPHTGRAHVIGVTGPPGAGKSTVVDELIHILRNRGVRIGVLAVDPNSPFSGGAILGDRIRMNRHATDPDVYIRSMGARGHLGGLALAARNAIHVLDAMGHDVVLVETVGVGQSELEVAENADTTVVVVPPGLGDGVQAIKAGIMEIADIFVVNKADFPQAEKTVSDIRDLLRMELRHRAWTPPIVRTTATQGQGIEELWLRIRQHQSFLESSGELKNRRERRLEQEILDLAERQLRQRWLEPSAETPAFQEQLELAYDRKLDPYDIARSLVSSISSNARK